MTEEVLKIFKETVEILTKTTNKNIEFDEEQINKIICDLSYIKKAVVEKGYYIDSLDKLVGDEN